MRQNEYLWSKELKNQLFIKEGKRAYNNRLLFIPRVLQGSVVKCLTRNPGILGSSRTRSSWFIRGSVLGQDNSEPQPDTGKMYIMWAVVVIWLKYCWKRRKTPFNKSINSRYSCNIFLYLNVFFSELMSIN